MPLAFPHEQFTRRAMELNPNDASTLAAFALAAGHRGVPTVIFAGEAFFGQDRFDVLMWRMKQYGLKPRSGR